MSLLTTYSSYNRVVISDTMDTYSISRVSGSWTKFDGNAPITYNEAWEIRRFRSKSYSYVGMTYDTAEACMVNAVAYYTRSVITSEWNSSLGVFVDKSGESRIMADISLVHRAGGMWDVTISVNEEDSRLSLVRVTPHTQFPAENSRHYDSAKVAFQ